MFFYVSKLLSFLLHPGNLIVFLLVIAFLLSWAGRVKFAKYIFMVITLVSVIVSTIPFGNMLGRELEGRFPQPIPLPSEVDGIIVLSGAVHPQLSNEHNQLVLQSNVERLFAFADLAKKYPQARLVYTGGSGSLFNQHLKEASYAEVALTALGVNTDKVIFENQSRNTYESVVLTRKLIDPQVEEKWILVTSAAHIPRAVSSFRQENWNVIAYPVDYNYSHQAKFWPTFDFAGNSNVLSMVLHEYVGLLFYWLTGRASELNPK